MLLRSPRLRALAPALLFLSLSALPVRAQTAAPASVPRLTHPGAGQTFYFVLTDRFANGNPANDTGGYAGGPAEHGFDPTRISHYHGGDFVGLTSKLDYLKNLGVTAVWVTPPFKNKPMQQGTAGYHGYWITDFLAIDPHLGTNDEYRTFVREAHARGMRVFMDIIVNHTADVIGLQGDHSYKSIASAPYRDASGQPFDSRAVAFNGLGDPAAFPALSAATSFPYPPTVPAAEASVKNPAWLNDVTLYHNRGNTTFAGENAVHGDFVGLDDLFTEHPRVVNGFVDIFSHWLEAYGVDGYRIDTARHVNTAFWQAFSPAIRAKAAAIGRPDFLQFGEVYNEVEGPSVLSEFSTSTMPIDTTIDFGFFIAARRYVSQAGTASAFADFFARDDYYTDHDSNVHATTTFLGNHDAGRFAYFLQQDNPGAAKAQLEALVKFGHGLLYLVRGQPVLYYGDEQGMIGRGGNDMQARESMFPAQAPDFRDASLLGTERTGADEKFDEAHPFYAFFKNLGTLRANHAALRTGAMIVRPTSDPAVFAFSRVDRTEKVEYFAAFNASRTATITCSAPTSGRPGNPFDVLYSSDQSVGELAVDGERRVNVTLAPLQFAVWKARAPLPAQNDGSVPVPTIALVNPAPNAALAFTQREADGLLFPSRQEIRAEVSGGDGVAEVTFALQRASRPGQLEWLGTDDAAPYRIFWNPPADLTPGETLTFIATVSDLRGQQISSEVAGVTVASGAASAPPIAFGIPGARSPLITSEMPAEVALAPGVVRTLFVAAEGTGPLSYQWICNDEEIVGATNATLVVTHAGHYRVLVRNLAGTAISATTNVVEARSAAVPTGRRERLPDVASQFVATRRVDVWLPPGYDANAGERYPVVYFHDGQNLFDPASSYGGVPWSADRAMEQLIAARAARPAILVGVWNTGATRFAEYMPQKAVSGEVVARYAGGTHVPATGLQSDAYLKFLVTELKPVIDRTYRTRPGPADTFVVGSSMGGLISAYAVCEYPAVFGGAGCVSTHWPAGDGAMIDYLAQHLPKSGTHRFWFDYGTRTLDATYEPHQLRADAVMRAAGYVAGRDYFSQKYAGAEHSEKAWRERVDHVLAFLLRG